MQRVVMPDSGLESWTVLDKLGVPLEPVERFLAYLASIGVFAMMAYRNVAEQKKSRALDRRGQARITDAE